MPKEKQTRKQWIAKIRRDVGPYFKVTVFYFILFCLFVCCCFFFQKITPFLAWLSCLLSARFNILTLLYITIYR